MFGAHLISKSSSQFIRSSGCRLEAMAVQRIVVTASTKQTIRPTSSTFNASPFVYMPSHHKGLYLFAIENAFGFLFELGMFECLARKGYCKLIAIIIYKLDAISILYGYLIFPLHSNERTNEKKRHRIEALTLVCCCVLFFVFCFVFFLLFAYRDAHTD